MKKKKKEQPLKKGDEVLYRADPLLRGHVVGRRKDIIHVVWPGLTEAGKYVFVAHFARHALPVLPGSLSGLGVRKRNCGRARTDINDFDAHIGNM